MYICIYIYIYVSALSSHGPPPQPMVSPPSVLLIVKPLRSTEVQGDAAATYMEIALEHNYMTKFSSRESMITIHQPHHTPTHPIPQGGEGKYPITMMCAPDCFVLPLYIPMPKLNLKNYHNVSHAPPHPHPQGGEGGSITMARGWGRGASQSSDIYIYIYI